MISNNQIVINRDLSSSIVEFIESDESISNVVIFTQSKIQKSEPDLLQKIRNKINADIIILDEGESSKELGVSGNGQRRSQGGKTSKVGSSKERWRTNQHDTNLLGAVQAQGFLRGWRLDSSS